jgi:hypothetical protein
MTPATDDDALEAAFEALLAGRSASPAAGGLAAFADGVRATAARPPRPSAALAELLATGLLTDQSSVPAPRAAARSRRRSTRMFLAFFTKLAAAGVAAKAAVVGGVVVVGLSTAGFADALPAPAQHAFATVVDAATPLTAPDTTTTAVVDAPTAPQQAVTAPVVTAPEGTTPAETPTAPKAPTLPSQSQGLGGVVSGMAHDGTITPGAVSSLAHKRNEDRRAATGGTATTDPTTGDDSGEAGDDSGKTTTTTTTTTVTEDSGHGGSSSGSKGKGHGNG